MQKKTLHHAMRIKIKIFKHNMSITRKLLSNNKSLLKYKK